MSNGKRYYWLKLHDDFFNSKRIKKMRRMAGGDTYTIIYLKLQLMAMKKDGVLTFSGLEPTFAEELALDLDEEVDDVRMTLAYLVSCGLAESNGEATLFFPYAVENVGSEGASSARVRAFRERQNTEALPEALHCNISVTERREEKEIEKRDRDREEKREEKTRARDPFSAFVMNQDDQDLTDALLTWLSEMSAGGSPLTPKEQGEILDKLRLEFPRDEWIPAIQRSTEKKWRSVYQRSGDRKTAKKAAEKKAMTEREKYWAEPVPAEETERLLRKIKEMESWNGDE